jgi:hypothetical protein
MTLPPLALVLLEHLALHRAAWWARLATWAARQQAR